MAWLAGADLPLERCRDVFLGLPRVILDGDRVIRGVIVCVDDVLPEEFEFFALAGRHRPDVEVLVYSRLGESAGVQSALRQGAKVCTPAAVRRLAEKVKTGAGERAQVSTFEKTDATATGGESEASEISDLRFPRSRDDGLAGASPAQCVAPAAGKSGPADEAPRRVERPAQVDASPEVSREAAEREAASEEPDETTRGTRVPWIRYQDAPVRGRPGGGAGKTGLGGPRPPASSDDAAQTSGSAESDVNRTSGLAEPSGPAPLPERVAAPRQAGEAPAGFEPLLTEEELAALMSDDFEGLVAEERESLLDDLGERP